MTVNLHQTIRTATNILRCLWFLKNVRSCHLIDLISKVSCQWLILMTFTVINVIPRTISIALIYSNWLVNIGISFSNVIRTSCLYSFYQVRSLRVLLSCVKLSWIYLRLIIPRLCIRYLIISMRTFILKDFTKSSYTGI